MTRSLCFPATLAMVMTLAATTACTSDSTESGSTSTSPAARENGDMGHSHGGLHQAEPLPTGQAHPAALTTQELYGLGRAAVFAIRGRRGDNLEGFGTGFIVNRDDGMGITTAHVVTGMSAISGRFSGGATASLHVIASDPCTDLAVVHFSSPLPAATTQLLIGDSSYVKPGDEVTALGYSALYANPISHLSISVGKVNTSKVTAKPPHRPEYQATIQHDAMVGRGAEGGPLLDHHGRVAGINVLSTDLRVSGQSLSVPIGPAAAEMSSKLLQGKSQNDMGWAVDEYYPGYFTEADVRSGLEKDRSVRARGIKRGLYVKDVSPGSGAARAGIKPGMLITRLNGSAAVTIRQSCDIVESILPGATAEVEGIRLFADGSSLSTDRFRHEVKVPGPH